MDAEDYHDLNKSTESETAFNHNHDRRNLMVKTELCRRFRRGVCGLGSKCNYAHSVAELRRQPKLCRLFLQNKHCPYGRTCRFLHSTTIPPPFPIPNPQFQPELGKLHRYPSAEYNTMQTSAAAPSDGYCSAEYRIMQTSAAASNASTSSSHKNEPSYPVKRIFKENELQKISRIYADWI
ncbi:putative zinc finger CCCH domain-containing protein 21 [Spatholobus suberectus]|nr:putative zinc finger CCCH domain-containing protein 21 [Spatholobus suberectus]